MSDKQTISRILIADNNLLFREKMKQIISDHFGPILTYESSSEREVLDEISRHTFDILILDLELSDGNGFNLLKKIKLLIPDTPVLGMSMFPVKQYEESVLKEGAQGYVSKVNMSNELRGALQSLFQGNTYFNSRETENSGEKSP